jgi:hypothetical protein
MGPDFETQCVRERRSRTNDGFESLPANSIQYGDRVAEHWGVTDVMALMQQIGAIPEP